MGVMDSFTDEELLIVMCIKEGKLRDIGRWRREVRALNQAVMAGPRLRGWSRSCGSGAAVGRRSLRPMA